MLKVNHSQRKLNSQQRKIKRKEVEQRKSISNNSKPKKSENTCPDCFRSELIKSEMVGRVWWWCYCGYRSKAKKEV